MTHSSKYVADKTLPRFGQLRQSRVPKNMISGQIIILRDIRECLVVLSPNFYFYTVKNGMSNRPSVVVLGHDFTKFLLYHTL